MLLSRWSLLPALVLATLGSLLVLTSPVPAESCPTGRPAGYGARPDYHRPVLFGHVVPTTFFETRDVFIFNQPIVVAGPPAAAAPAASPAPERPAPPPDRIDGPLPRVRRPAGLSARPPAGGHVDMALVKADLRSCAACHTEKARRGPSLFLRDGALNPRNDWAAVLQATSPGANGEPPDMPPPGKGAPLSGSALERLRQLAAAKRS